MILEWPEPAPEPLDWLFPTALESMRLCPRRLAYQRDARTRIWERRGTRASLGLAAHRLTELVLGGLAPTQDRRAWLEKRWRELLEDQHRQLSAQWPTSEVPPVERWPGVTATRVRLVRTLESITGIAAAGELAQQATPSNLNVEMVGTGGMPALPWVERTLFDHATRLAGRPDRVEKRAGVLRLIDFKSGVRQAEPDDRQKRQLLLYAHLVRTMVGRLPDEVAIADVRGAEHHVSATPQAVDEAAADALLTADRFITMASTACFPGAPAPRVCRACPFRVVCTEYWEARRSDWPSLDVRGVVISRSEDSIILAVQSPTSNERVRLVGANRSGVVTGDEVVAVDLERAGTGAVRLRWWSRVRYAGERGAEGEKPR